MWKWNDARSQSIIGWYVQQVCNSQKLKAWQSVLIREKLTNMVSCLVLHKKSSSNVDRNANANANMNVIVNMNERGDVRKKVWMRGAFYLCRSVYAGLFHNFTWTLFWSNDAYIKIIAIEMWLSNSAQHRMCISDVSFNRNDSHIGWNKPGK